MKYIVYKTTNLVNNYIYIGVHKTETPYEFDKYLGNGIYINKPNTYEKAKTCFQQAVKQYGINNFRRETLSVFNTAEEAYFTEGLIVNESFLARPDVYNMIKGGSINYTIGKKIYKYSAETGMYICEYASIADAGKDIKSDPSTITHSIILKFKLKNYLFSLKKEPLLNLEDYNFKIKIPIYRYLKTGEFDKEFASLNEAGKHSLNTSAVYIQKAARLGYLVKDTFYFSFYRSDFYDKARSLEIKNRAVYQYSSSGEFLREYKTQELAEKENKNCNITKSIKGRCLDFNNHYWSLEKLNYFNIPKKNSSKKVAKLDENGNIIQTWDSSNLCAKEVGTAVKNVLRGKYETHKGFRYKYIL